MRITPTREQMDYLASIGALKGATTRPDPTSSAPAEKIDSSAGRSARPGVRWWVILLIILLLVLFLARLARAEETWQSANSAADGAQVASGGGNTPLVERLNAIEMELSKLKDAAGHDDALERLVVLQSQIKTMEQRLTTIQETLRSDVEKDRQLVAKKLQLVEAGVNDLKSGAAKISAPYGQRNTAVGGPTEAGMEKAHVQGADGKIISSQRIDTEVKDLREDLAAQREDFHQTLVCFSIIVVLGIGLLIIGRIIMERRIRQLEQSVISRPGETVAITSGTPIPLPVSGKGMGLAENTDTQETIKIQPTRPQLQPLPTTIKQMQEIIVSADCFRGIRVKPTIPCGPWEIGLATNKGNVRSENQDSGVCFKIDGHYVLIEADGCGGLPHGQRAAQLAVDGAAKFVVGAFGMAPRWHNPDVRDVATKAIRQAELWLAAEGDKLNITDVAGGLRTTLIVVIGSQREIGYAYIGDGGGCVVKSTGEINQFLDPQKAGGYMNVLAASLGSKTEGEPVTGVMKRDPGDLVIVGTDGVFDRVESTFPKDVLRGCIQYKGDLQKTAEHIVEELASFEDSAGYICDDNLTLGIMGDGNTPKLSRGFWSSVGETKLAQGDLTLSREPGTLNL